MIDARAETSEWAAGKLAQLRDRLAGVRSYGGFPASAPRGLKAVPLPDPAAATLADLAAVEALIAMRDAAVLPPPETTRALVVEVKGAYGAPISDILRVARPELECVVVDDEQELAALSSDQVHLAAGVLSFSRLDAAACVAAVDRLGVPFVYALDHFTLPGGDSLVRVLAERYWPREIPVFPSSFTEPPADLPQIVGVLGRDRPPSIVGPAVRDRQGSRDAPRHLVGWRRRDA